MYKLNSTEYWFNYDVDGTRIGKNMGGGSYYVFYANGPDGKTEVADEVPYGENITINLWANGDNIAQVRNNGGSISHYYYLSASLCRSDDRHGGCAFGAKDHLGDIKMVLNSSGAVDSYNDYYPYGEQMPGRNSAGSADGRYKFTSKERDVETGYDYFGARYYDPWRGQWNSGDTLTNNTPSISPYIYANDNPNVYIDKEGKYAVKSIGGYIFASTIDPYTIGWQQAAELLPLGVGDIAMGLRGIRSDRWWTPSAGDYLESFAGEKLLGTIGNVLLGGAEALWQQSDLIDAFNTDKEVFSQLLLTKVDGENLFLRMEPKDITNGVVALGKSNGLVILLNPALKKWIRDHHWTQEGYVNWIIDQTWQRTNPSLYMKLNRNERGAEADPEDQYNAENSSPPEY